MNKESAIRRITMLVERLEERYTENPPIQDRVDEFNYIQTWEYVVPAYTLVEQSMKLLLNRVGERGHDIDHWYCELDDNHKKEIRRVFDAWANLYNAPNPFHDADIFIGNIGAEYGKWRYWPTEDESLSSMLPGAFLQIAFALRDLLYVTNGTLPRARTVDDKIRTSIYNTFSEALRELDQDFHDEDMQKELNLFITGDSARSEYTLKDEQRAFESYIRNGVNPSLRFVPRLLQIVHTSLNESPDADIRQYLKTL